MCWPISEECAHGKILKHFTLQGGERTNNYTPFQNVSQMSECIDRCCTSKNCDLALMKGASCYGVSCENENSCHLERVEEGDAAQRSLTGEGESLISFITRGAPTESELGLHVTISNKNSSGKIYVWKTLIFKLCVWQKVRPAKTVKRKEISFFPLSRI